MIQPEVVKRKDGKAYEVVYLILGITVTFTRVLGRKRLSVSKVKDSGLNYGDALYIPRPTYKEVEKQAYGILYPKVRPPKVDNQLKLNLGGKS